MFFVEVSYTLAYTILIYKTTVWQMLQERDDMTRNLSRVSYMNLSRTSSVAINLLFLCFVFIVPRTAVLLTEINKRLYPYGLFSVSNVTGSLF